MEKTITEKKKIIEEKTGASLVVLDNLKDEQIIDAYSVINPENIDYLKELITLGYDEQLLKSNGVRIKELYDAVVPHKTNYESILVNDKNKVKAIINKNVPYLTFNDFKELQQCSKIAANDLVVLGGFTGGRKSTFAINLMLDLAEEYECLYLNLEMGETEMTRRLLSAIGINDSTPIQYNDLVTKETSDIELNLITEMKEKACTRLAKKQPIHVISDSVDIDDIKYEIKMMDTNSKEKPLMVFIDHAGLIGVPEMKSKGLYEKTTYLAQELRKLTNNNNIVLFALSQLSRQKNKDGSLPEPELWMLRDSGEWEQSASKVLFVYGMTDEENKYHQYIKLAKSRNSATPKIIEAKLYNNTFKMSELGTATENGLKELFGDKVEVVD